MVEKDKKNNTKVKKVKTPPVTQSKITPQETKEAPEIKVVEPQQPAIMIAQLLNISSFDFFRVKQEAGLTDGSFLTISEFKNIYNKIIKR